MAAGDGPSSAGADRDLDPWLQEEVAQLPAKYREPVVLCYFEGRTHDEAASHLGCPLGTIKGRLSRARDLLKRRLTRRGFTLSAAALAAHLGGLETRAAVPAALHHATFDAARAIAATAGRLSAATAVSQTAVTLVTGVLHAMTVNQVRAIAVPLLVLAAVSVGVVGVAFGLSQDARTNPPGQAALEQVPRNDANNPPASATGSLSKAMQKQFVGRAAKPASPAPERPVENPTLRELGPLPAGGGGEFIDREAIVDGWTPEARDRFEIAQLAAMLVACDKSPENKGVSERLEERIPMSFAEPTPLRDVIKYIKSEAAKKTGALPLPIYVDPRGLEESEVSLDRPVTLDLETAPLKTSLRLMLKQLGLAYCVRDGVIIISSVGGVRAELAEAARELVGAGNEEVDFDLLSTIGVLRRRRMVGAGGMMGGRNPAGAGQLRTRGGRGSRDGGNEQ
jgi:hypothetical protein